MPETAHLPIVMASGYARDRDRRAALAAGVDVYLIKPVDLFTLVDDLRSLLE